MGKVYLVGAGCGNLDLYTVKAMKCIENADCLVYDQLVDHRILLKVKDDCECIYVGKQAANHAMKQEDINQMLVDKSKQYDSVVRLKGGDVFVFGRGGEEAQLLYDNHIDFEVVPGLSSVTAGLAYAGVPITHRGMSGGFQVYTGSLKQNEERIFDFSTMLDDYCTYVFLMSMSKLNKIVEGFKEAGKHIATPVAIISKASMPSQRVLVGTLENIVEKFQAAPLDNPGIIVVGEVVKMREILNFYENKPLFSKKCLVTSIGHDYSLFEKLNDLGANAHHVMTGMIEYLDVDIPRLDGVLVFTSKHGVIGFMNNFKKQYKDLRALKDVLIVSIGKKTNEVLNEYGLDSDFIPSKADSDYLNEELQGFAKGRCIYLIKGENETNIKDYHKSFVVYRNNNVTIDSKINHYDYGFFTCASSVKRFKAYNDSVIDVFVSIGKHTSNAIRECYGDVKILETDKAVKEHMIDVVLRGE